MLRINLKTDKFDNAVWNDLNSNQSGQISKRIPLCFSGLAKKGRKIDFSDTNPDTFEKRNVAMKLILWLM